MNQRRLDELIKYAQTLCNRLGLSRETAEDIIHQLIANGLTNGTRPLRWSYRKWHWKIRYACLDQRRKEKTEASWLNLVHTIIRERNPDNED